MDIEEIDIRNSDHGSRKRPESPPSSSFLPTDSRRSGQAYREEVEDVREEDGRHGVVEETIGVIRVAEQTLGCCVRAVGQIETPPVEGCQPVLQRMVKICKRFAGT